MDHVDLKPYPMPAGLDIPRLMPFQEFPWNGDGYLAAEVLRLKHAHGLKYATETGMCLGSTTCWLSEHFEIIVTCEVNPEYGKIGLARCGDRFGVHVFSHPSPVVLSSQHHVDEGNSIFYFLDAHWGPNCPLLEELEVIIKTGTKPCILIHDFKVPGTDFGFDKMPDGRPFDLDLIRDHLDSIYGINGWKHNYPTKVEGARRGWISIEPWKQ